MASKSEKSNEPEHVYDPGDPAAMPYMTNIDRRTCKREVPMKVLCLGVSRTGTVSLRQALVTLGYKDVYHFASVLQENPRDADMWTEAFNAKFKGQGKEFEKKDWDQLLGHCMATTDTPSVLFYKELLAAYPEAKVILTERDDAGQWHRSQMSSVIPFFIKQIYDPSTFTGRIRAFFSPLDTDVYAFNHLVVQCSPMYQALIHDWRTGAQTGKKWYEDYNKEIKEIVPKDKLLVYNVKQGWGPLCEFLGEKPPPFKFPVRNDRQTFEKNLDGLDAMVQEASQKKMMTVGGGAIAVLAIIVGLLIVLLRS